MCPSGIACTERMALGFRVSVWAQARVLGFAACKGVWGFGLTGFLGSEA